MNADVAGVLLAGGLSRRMGGGDKCLRPLDGRPILQHIIDRIQPQVASLVLNANGDLSRFHNYGLPVVSDTIEGFAGPLAGILAGMRWAASQAPACRWIVSVPTDAPFVPTDLVSVLKRNLISQDAKLACAASRGRVHPVVGLWPVSLADELECAMLEEDIRKIDLWTARYRIVEVPFVDEPVDPFFNTNRPDDLAEAERLLADEG